jgi:uncharacterized membrane protein YbhN (UPF0104 family)
LEKEQLNKAIENCVAIPLIALIGLYLTASAIDPLLQLNNQTFRITFTIAAGIPAITLFFKKNLSNKLAELKETTTKKNQT